MKLRALALAVSTLLTTSVMAHNDECDVNLHGNLEYNKKMITVEMDSGSVMTIAPDNQLTINGEAVTLDDDQQQYVDDYRTAIDEAVPMTVNLVSVDEKA